MPGQLVIMASSGKNLDVFVGKAAACTKINHGRNDVFVFMCCGA
ncbi:hypothetical protein RchiOBHm_Chr5g0014541 [Rosa chinensis]|uniref:Uncharacterized protein n=1 Tax=Rosa chinensis TaxID=74649 RepID=A0A2P6Q5R7_ROSCH|nr:hypothetical protein RchiOBHm_Chr5g0014541 [Rosa chinensis]